MMDRPSAGEIVESVRAFLETTVMPQLTGHAAFHARVAANALGIVARELAQRPEAEAAEHARLRQLLGMDGPRDALARELCARIRARAIRLDDPVLAAHLRATAIAKVRIDQPAYAGLATALTPSASG